MKNKKGDYKWGVVLSLILGVMVLSLSLYFIFQELWSDDELDMEICRQSIQVRALLPDIERGGITVDSFKDQYPLKCKTQVVNIEKSDVIADKDGKMPVERKIAETMATCWALYDKGDSNAFPARFFKSSVCVPCARIHLTEEAKKELEKKGIKEINIRNALDLPMTKEYSYYKYLNNSGKKFAAFNFGNGLPFNLEGEKFENKNVAFIENAVRLINRLNGASFVVPMISSSISLPKTFDISKGDLLINYGVVTLNKKDFGDHVPYLFYFQQGQTDPSPFEEVKKDLLKNLKMIPIVRDLKTLAEIPEKGLRAFSENDVGLCEEWEGIPA